MEDKTCLKFITRDGLRINPNFDRNGHFTSITSGKTPHFPKNVVVDARMWPAYKTIKILAVKPRSYHTSYKLPQANFDPKADKMQIR